MARRTSISVDRSTPVVLQNLPDTGSWNTFRWSDAATIQLTKGVHVLRWTNFGGGGLNWDAFAFSDDANWKPVGTDLKVAEGKHLVIIQAEAFSKQQTKDLSLDEILPPAFKDHFPLRAGDIKEYSSSPHPEIHILPAWGWVNTILQVEKIDAANRTVWVKKNSSASEELRVGNRYFVSNVFEELDQPGEWWRDAKTGIVYLLPKQNSFSRHPVVAPVLDRIFDLKGDAANDRWVEKISMTYLVRIQNDSTAAQRFVIKAVESGESGWTVVYRVSGNNVTTALKSSAGRTTASLAAGASETVTIEMTPGSAVPRNTGKSMTINVFNSSTDTVVRDSVQATTQAVRYQPDLQIRTSSGSFIGDNIFNTTATNQTITNPAAKAATATYYIRIQNDGDATDRFRLKSTAGSSGWTVRYYDNQGGADVTAAVVQGTWTSPLLSPNGTYDVRCTVFPGSRPRVGSTLSLLATATSFGDTTRKDAVKSTSTATN